MAEDLDRVVKLSELLLTQQREVKEKEEELKAVKAAALRTEREDLPTLMTELGLTEIKLANGSTVKITEDVDCGITDATRDRALAWLLKNNFGGLIKTEVAVKFGRGDHDEATRVRDQLTKEYDGVVLVETVHWQTLKAFVREQMAGGKKIPMTYFNVYPYSKAVIKEKK